MEELVRQLSTTDTKKKLLVGQQLIEFLGDPESVAECDDMGACVDSLVPWMQSSNFKVPKAEQNFSDALIQSAVIITIP